jgi:hypothetical protein
MKDFWNTWFLSRTAAQIVLVLKYSVATHYIQGSIIGWRVMPKTPKMLELWKLAKVNG